MPRKMRAGKERRQTGWEIGNLHPLYDLLTLHSGRIRSNPIHPGVRIQSLEDARQAWEANKHLFVMCTCHRDKPYCKDHEFKYSPGERPWAYWYFDLGYPAIPDDEPGELQRLGLISPAEREAMQPRSETAEVCEFSRRNEEEGEPCHEN